jgi:hypothetical protein
MDFNKIEFLERISQYTANYLEGEIEITIDKTENSIKNRDTSSLEIELQKLKVKRLKINEIQNKDKDKKIELNKIKEIFKIIKQELPIKNELKNRENKAYIKDGFNYLYLLNDLETIKNIYNLINVRIKEFEAFKSKNKDLFPTDSQSVNTDTLNNLKKELSSYIDAMTETKKIKAIESTKTPNVYSIHYSLLDNLYYRLEKREYLKCNKTNFNKLFNGTEKSSIKLEWNSSIGLLKALFKELKKKLKNDIQNEFFYKECFQFTKEQYNNNKLSTAHKNEAIELLS